MSNLTILNTAIRQTDNLFNLNDLHSVSGGENRHAPFRFTRLETTSELIAEMQKEDPTATPLKVLRGTQGGTFACEELVIAYAMWISPKFHLIVLRAFLAMHKAKTQPKQLELPKPMPQTVTIPYPGRWLVVTNEFDQNKVIVKNIDGNNCVEAKIHRKIISETHLMADLLMELAKRMRVLDGEASPSRLETPILESKCRTILF